MVCPSIAAPRWLLDKFFISLLKLEFKFIINFWDLWKLFSIDITTLFFIDFITILLIDPVDP